MSKFTSDGLTQSGTGCFVAIQPASTDCIPRCRRITFGHRAFSVVGPMVWNSLPTEFRGLSVGFGVLGCTLKTIDYYSRNISAFSAIEMYA